MCVNSWEVFLVVIKKKEKKKKTTTVFPLLHSLYQVKSRASPDSLRETV